MTDDGIVLSPTEVRFERLLPGPIESVWTYLTDSRKRGEWLASGPMDLRVGGRVQLRFKHQDLSPNKAPPPDKLKEIDRTGHDSTGEITELDPPRHLAFTWGSETWGWSEVVFDLEPKGDKILLTLTHRKLPNRDGMVGVMGGWHAHLAILVEKAHGHTPDAFWDVWRRTDGYYETRVPR
jgi:uncharacterized protein YndB with AHSA1/START domain